MEAELGRLVGEANVVADAAIGDAGGLSGTAAALVLPGTAEEVAAVVAWCYARDIPMVPVGGRTGYAGGCVPQGESVAIGLDRLDRIRSFDPLLWRMEAEAGVRTATVARLARENGLRFPPDPGAAEQSQIGGNIACNAGGPHAFRHGATGAWVTGVEAVLAPGELVRVGGPVRKDVAGYDLRGLLIGSEGTLGIVTAAWLRLIPAAAAALPVAAFFDSVAAGCEAIERILGSGVVPGAIEYLDGATVALAGGSFPGEVPAGAAMLVIAEAESQGDREELAEALGGAAQHPDPTALWRWRDGVSIAVTAARGAKLSEDIGVPLDRLAEGIEGTLEIGRRHGLDACSWGHAGDGNLHATFLLEPGDAQMAHRAQAAAQDLFDLAVSLGGTISGEHGIGVLKRGQLARQWGPAAVAAHLAVKAALDPKGLFNPGKKAP